MLLRSEPSCIRMHQQSCGTCLVRKGASAFALIPSLACPRSESKSHANAAAELRDMLKEATDPHEKAVLQAELEAAEKGGREHSVEGMDGARDGGWLVRHSEGPVLCTGEFGDGQQHGVMHKAWWAWVGGTGPLGAPRCCGNWQWPGRDGSRRCLPPRSP